MVRYQLRNFSKTSKTPRRAYDKERLDSELKMIGTYGLKNKREIWRNGLILSKVRAVARNLLTMDEKVSNRLTWVGVRERVRVCAGPPVSEMFRTTGLSGLPCLC